MTVSQEFLNKKQYDKDNYDNARLSFKDYLSYIGKDYQKEYNNALLNLDAKGAKADPYYGKSGESLRQMGLVNSGYANYLKEQNQKTLSVAKDSLYASYLKNLDSSKDSYANYIMDYQQKQNNIAKTLISRLESDGVLDFDRAYQLALKEGLNEANAKAAAESGIKAARDSIYYKIIDLIGKYKYSRERAEIYARQMGLSPEDVMALGDYAYRINEEIYGSGSLIDDLENQHQGT